MAKKTANFLFEDLSKPDHSATTLSVVLDGGQVGFVLFQGKVQVAAASLQTAEDVAKQLLAFVAEVKGKKN